jgi:hypothetical protein
VTSGGFSDTSDGVFSIAELATNVDVSQVCPDEATFAWSPVSDAESYDLYILGDKYMEVEGNTNSTSITVPIADPNDEIWFAVVAKNDTEGWESRRTIAEYHPGGLINCSLADDMALESINNTESDFNTVCNSGDPVTISITVRNTGINDQSNFMVSYQLDSEPVVEEMYTETISSGQQDVFEFATPLEISDSGTYTLTARVDLVGDLNSSNDEATFDFFAVTEAASLDFAEDFETNGFPPPGWIVLNFDNDTTWEERSGITGSDGNSSVTAFIDNYTYNAQGEEDIIKTVIFDLVFSSVPTLTFDLAKAQYSTSFSDALRVDASIDCGVSYVTIYEKDGLDLSTVPGYITSNWTPSGSDDWRNEEIDLTPFEGENVIFQFVNINGYGNSTFIDNINVFAEELGVDDFNERNITIYPNPTSEFVHIGINSSLGGSVKVQLNNNLGQNLYSSNANDYHDGYEMTLNVSDLSSGLYFVTIQIEDRVVTKKLVVQ